ncbi:FAD-dependent monooxygenase [Actinoplanes sp. GCM10030250]|uniref:FAD-dependent monooxygenase n=1 Tax=Actinoplanes sp. GCM10030250 TaxID=3273376 RepID=UPI0036237937
MIDVLIAGAGPAGLMLACELRLAGVDVVVVERHETRPDFCRGFTLNARSLDLLARRGLAEPLVAEGWRVPHAAFTSLPVVLGLADAYTDHPFTLGIPQTRVEEFLEDHARELGADIRRGQELEALDVEADSVVATVGGERLRAAYVIGCDGGRSTVRKHAGIAFPGTPATRFSLLGDVSLADPGALPFGVTTGPGGAVFLIPRPGYVRIVVEDPRPDSPATLTSLQSAIDQALGRHVELIEPRWVTRFGDAARQAERYVSGRVILAGDAAHIHPPAGAIGVNVALDDALNLGWKLAATVRGTAPEHLLESYHSERHAAGQQVLASTQAQALLGNAGDDLRPLLDLLTRIAAHPAGNRAFADVVTALDTRYEMTPGGSHPWLGRLCPNLRVTTADGDTDVATLLSGGRPVLIGDATAQGPLDVVAATFPDHPDLRAILLRPDGHTAWVGGDGLDEALRHWVGAPFEVHA